MILESEKLNQGRTMGFPPTRFIFPFTFYWITLQKMSVELFVHNTPQVHLKEDTGSGPLPSSPQLENPLICRAMASPATPTP